METPLAALLNEISKCRICAQNPNGDGLPHEPRPVLRASPSSKICIAGQAPGTRVHASGIPFDDPSGDRLREWLGVDRETFYNVEKFTIIPMGFCFPGLDAKGGDLPPRKECRDNWHDQLYEFLPQLELILVIGQYAHAYHLKSRRRKTLTETVSNWQEYFNADQGPRYLPLPHPSWRNNSWIKKNPWFGEEVLPVLKKQVAELL